MTTIKIYKRIAIAGLLIMLGSVSSMAQVGRFSIGGDLAVPIGNFSNITTVGIGAFGKYEAEIKSVENLNWTAQAGFVVFPGKNNNGYSFTTTALNFQGGGKYYFVQRSSGWYGSADLGLSFLVGGGDTYYDQNGNAYRTGSRSFTRVAFAPGAGYQMGNWDFAARFVLLSDFTYFNLRAAYVFGGR